MSERERSVFGEQREWRADDEFHPLQKRPNDKKIGEVDLGSATFPVNLTNFHA